MMVSNQVRIFLTLALMATVCAGINYDPEKFEKCNGCGDLDSCATIFQERHYGGWAQCIPLYRNNCLTLAEWWQAGGGRLSSIDTHGKCVRLFTDVDCQGSSVELSPPGTGHENLNEVGWEDIAKSISSCTRTPKFVCTVKDLFGTKISQKQVTDRIENAMKAILTATTGSIGGFFPGANVGFNLLQAIGTIASDDDSYDALIESKVKEEVALNAAVQIKVKTKIIENWLTTIASPNTSESDRRIELLIALHTCEEVFLLFQDSHYAFSSNKVLATPYLITFSNIYFGLASILYDIRTDLRPKLKKDIAELVRLNAAYLKDTKEIRAKQFRVVQTGSCNPLASAHGLPCGTVIKDTLTEKLYEVCDLMIDPPLPCYPSGDEDWYKRCAGNVQEVAKIELDNFFAPTIKRLQEFSKKT